MGLQPPTKKHPYPKRIPGLSLLQFAGIVVLVAGGIVFTGIALLSLTKQASPTSFFPIPTPTPKKQTTLIYNIPQPPQLPTSRELQTIVDEAVNLARIKGLPTKPLSITLIDMKTETSSGYQNEILRFPASVSKLFWMVELYAQVENKILPSETLIYTPECQTDICKLIQKSDNEAASRILDQLTSTTSGEKLDDKEYQTWLTQREQVNIFFQKAGYESINISQKNFPIPYLKMNEPQGRDLQMRGDTEHLIRNKMTTDHAARLMYEIFTVQAISPTASQNMMQLLTRDLRPEIWKQEQYNSVEGFLGQSLPVNEVYFASKVGWTSTSRQETAYIATKDGKAAYILTIFADDPLYADDWKIFPQISLYVYNRMHNLR